MRLVVELRCFTDYIVGWDPRRVIVGSHTTDTADRQNIVDTVAILGHSTVTTAVDLCSRNCNPFYCLYDYL